MKIQCDVCNKKEATVFCCADEAALCHGCDQGVHHANKLASKHPRLSLLHPPPSLAPLCDICKEKTAVLFCQQDRAILCRECDVPLHTANEHTQKHDRFLLTGIQLSVGSDLGCDPVPDFESSRKPTSQISSSEPPVVMDSSSNNISGNDKLVSGGSSNSMSECLVEMLPGWHFQDFEDASFGFKSGNMNEFEVYEDVLSFWDVDIDKKVNFSTTCPSFQSEELGIFVPQAPVAATVTTTSVFTTNYQPSPNLQNPSLLNNNQGGATMKHQDSTNVFKVNRKVRKDDAFTVPQISHHPNPKPSVGSKRSRAFW